MFFEDGLHRARLELYCSLIKRFYSIQNAFISNFKIKH
jgi:hypothetical protein